MGLEAQCRARIGDQDVAVRALLESNELILRGEHRERLSFSVLDSIDAADGRLILRRNGEQIVLELGAAAATWADKIRHPRTLLDKLGVKAGQRVATVGLTHANLLAQLRTAVAPTEYPPIDARDPATGICDLPTDGADLDLVFIEVATLPHLDVLPALRSAIAQAGAVWVLHPKGSAKLNDVHVMAAGKAAGLVDNKVARVSDTLSALRLVIPKAARRTVSKPAGRA